jgi:LysR family transcriptional regulator, regulator for genes of the gallate degradation pathway
MSRQPSLPNLRHLEVFRTVVRCRSLSAAAAQLPLSQPAVTQAIVGLERYFGVALFKRYNRGMQLTVAGEHCLLRIERALGYLTASVEELRLGAALGQSRSGLAGLTAAQLQALMASVEHGGFSAAARRVGVSRPTIHRAARGAEDALGVALFESTSFGMRPTRAAELMARGARLASYELQQALAELSVAATGTTVIGSMPLARSVLLPRALHEFTGLIPEHRVTVLEGTYAALLAGLRGGQIDWLIGALRGQAAPVDVVEQHLFDDPLAIIMRAAHPLAHVRGYSVQQLARFAWITPLHGSPLRVHFEALFSAAAVPVPATTIECNSLLAARALLVESDRLMLLSAQQIYYEQRAGLLVARPHPRGRVIRRIGVTQRRDWRPTSAQGKLLEILRHQARRLERGARSSTARPAKRQH